MNRQLTKTGILIIVLFFSMLFAKAQDVIYLSDGSQIKTKVISVGKRDVTYKRFSNMEGPAYTIDKDDIMMIIYENGENEMFSGSAREKADTNFSRNVISYHLFDVVFTDFAMSYERILKSGKAGIKIPVSFGYNYNDGSFDFRNIFYSGLGVNFYPTGQGKWRYFMGPQFRAGLCRSSDYYYYYNEYGNYVGDNYSSKDSFYFKFFIDNGVMFMPTRNFSISAIGSLGIRYIAKPENTNNSKVNTDGQFAFNISYRF